MRNKTFSAFACIAVLVAIVATPTVFRAQTSPLRPALVVQTGHQHVIERVAFSADDRLVASGDIGGSIRIWEAATGSQLSALPGHSGLLYALQFSRDGRWLASAGGTDYRFGDGPTVKMWDVASGK